LYRSYQLKKFQSSTFIPPIPTPLLYIQYVKSLYCIEQHYSCTYSLNSHRHLLDINNSRDIWRWYVVSTILHDTVLTCPKAITDKLTQMHLHKHTQYNGCKNANTRTTSHLLRETQTAATILKNTIFLVWHYIVHSLHLQGESEDGGARFVQNIRKLFPHYTASHSSWLSKLKSEISSNILHIENTQENIYVQHSNIKEQRGYFIENNHIIIYSTLSNTQNLSVRISWK